MSEAPGQPWQARTEGDAEGAPVGGGLQPGDAAAGALPRTLAIEGEMTIYRAAELRASLLAALADGSGDFTIDLAAVSEMDSAGVQLLMAAHKSAQAGGFALQLVGHSPAVLEVQGLLGLAALVPATDAVPH